MALNPGQGSPNRGGQQTSAGQDQINRSNSTLNMFLGRRIPVWMTGSSSHTHTSPSLPERPQRRKRGLPPGRRATTDHDQRQPAHAYGTHQQPPSTAESITRSNVNQPDTSTIVSPPVVTTAEKAVRDLNVGRQSTVLPSPAPSDEATSPAVTTAHNSPNPSTGALAMEVPDANSSTKGNNVRPGQTGGDGENWGLAITEAPGQGTVTRQESADTTAGGSTHDHIADDEESERWKRRRLEDGGTNSVDNTGTACAMASKSNWLKRLDAHISQGFDYPVVKQRIERLREALATDDMFFVILHQILMLWSIDQADARSVMAGLISDAVVDRACSIIFDTLRKNEGFTEEAIRWLSDFPIPLRHQDGTPTSFLAEQRAGIAYFLQQLSADWKHLMAIGPTRNYPLRAKEMIEALGLPSPTLLLIFFTVSRRNLGINDTPTTLPIIGKLQNLFLEDQRCYFNKSISHGQRLVYESQIESQYRRLSAIALKELRKPESARQGQEQQNIPQTSGSVSPNLAQAPAGSLYANHAQGTSGTSGFGPPNPMHGPVPPYQNAHQQQNAQQMRQQSQFQAAAAYMASPPNFGCGTVPHANAAPVSNYPIPDGQPGSPQFTSGQPVQNSNHGQFTLRPQQQQPSHQQQQQHQYQQQQHQHQQQYRRQQQLLSGYQRSLMTNVQNLATQNPSSGSQQGSPVTTPGTPATMGNALQGNFYFPTIGPGNSQRRSSGNGSWIPQTQAQLNHTNMMQASAGSPLSTTTSPIQSPRTPQMTNASAGQFQQQQQQQPQHQASLQAHNQQAPSPYQSRPTQQTASGLGQAPQVAGMPAQIAHAVQPAVPLRPQQLGTPTRSYPAPRPSPYLAQRQPNVNANQRLLPEPGRRINENEYPWEEMMSAATSLHMVDIMSPPRFLRGAVRGQGAPTPHQRYYQFIQQLVAGPVELSHSVLDRLLFQVADADYQRLAKPFVAPGRSWKVCEYADGALRCRFRVCEISQTDLVGGAPTMNTWMTSTTMWPDAITVKLNEGVFPKLPRKENWRKARPCDLTADMVAGINVVSVGVFSKPKAACSFFGAVEMVNTLSHRVVMDMVTSKGAMSVEETTRIIKCRLEPADADDVQPSEELSISLADPFSASLAKTAVRGEYCRHLDVFDLETWLQTRPGKRQCFHHREEVPDCPKCAKRGPPWQEPSQVDVWKCPICSADARPNSLRHDVYIQSICDQLVRQGKTAVKSVYVKADGSWRAKDEDLGQGLDDDDDDDSDDGEERSGKPKTKAAAVVSPVASSTAKFRQNVEVIVLDDD